MSSSYLERVFEKRFDPNQPRDERGRWSDDGAGIVTVKPPGKLTRTQALAGAKRVLRDIGDDFGYEGEIPEIEVRGREDVEPGFQAGIRNGRIVITEDWVDEAKDPEYGVSPFRQIAHEAVHVMVSGEPSVRGHNSHMVEEGGAELLSIDYWDRRGQPLDERDAVRRGSEWDYSLAATSVYNDEVGEVIRRSASRVGWNREAIRAEVERVMRGDHNVRLDFRDDSDPDAATPTGYAGDGESLLRWYLSTASGAKSYLERVFEKDSDRALSYLERVFEKFDPNQPRDERGRWSEVPGSGGVLPDLAPDAIEADRAVELTERLTDAEAAAGARQALRVINEVHAVPGGSVRTRSGDLVSDTAYGEYDSSLQEIRLNGANLPNIPQAAETFSHEFGHWLDNRLMKRATQDDYVQAYMSEEAFSTAIARERGRSVLGSEEGDALVPVARAILDSEAYQNLVERKMERTPDGEFVTYNIRSASGIGSSSFVSYLAQPREAFARAYAQWIASHRPRAFEAHYSAGSSAWTDEDFAPIGKAFDEAFEKLGLLKKESDG